MRLRMRTKDKGLDMKYYVSVTDENVVLVTNEDNFVSRDEYDDLYRRYKELEERERLQQKIIQELRKRNDEKSGK